jgi:hypothetical protein
MLLLSQSSLSTNRWLRAGVALVLICLVSACGLVGGDEGDDGEKFPEPPDRPNSAHVMDSAPGWEGEAPRSCHPWPAPVLVAEPEPAVAPARS